MKKYFVIGNPIDHSLSPKLHNYWLKKNNLDANYEKIAPSENEIKAILDKVKEKEISGINVTVPYKRTVIPFLETLSDTSKITNSVNTIFNRNGKIHGENTDVYGFEKSILINKINLKGKEAFIFGAGGVVSSIILGLRNLKIKKIYISNRTFKNAETIQKRFSFVEIIEWGKIKDADLFINSTSVGLSDGQDFKLDLSHLSEKKLFYDLIYNPPKTNFLQEAEKLGHKIINGRDMFVYQAQKAFSLWHDKTPIVDEKLTKHLFND